MTINSIQSTLTKMQQDLKEAGPTQTILFGTFVSSIALAALTTCSGSKLGMATAFGLTYTSYNTFQVATNMKDLDTKLVKTSAVAIFEAGKEAVESTDISKVVSNPGEKLVQKALEKNTLFFGFGVTLLTKDFLAAPKNPVLSLDADLIDLANLVKETCSEYLSKLKSN
jgi:hypothetical protein